MFVSICDAGGYGGEDEVQQAWIGHFALSFFCVLFLALIYLCIEGDSGLRVEVMVEGSVKAGLDTSQAVTTHNQSTYRSQCATNKIP